MTKLAKNMYTTAKGERKLNCYVISIPKEIVDKTDLADKLITFEAKENKIILKEKK